MLNVPKFTNHGLWLSGEGARGGEDYIISLGVLVYFTVLAHLDSDT
jgi:hypothetical protein